MSSELKNRGVSVALLISLTTVILGLSLSFSSVYAQKATPEPVVEKAIPGPPTPTPIAIFIEESVSVGETSGNGSLDPMNETIEIGDSTSTIDDPMNETIEIGDSTSTIDPMNETIEIGDSTFAEALELGKSPVNQQTKSSDTNQGTDERERKSRDAFSRGTGSVKESGEGSDNGNPGEGGNTGSGWMVVSYVVIGLVAVALLGLLGRRLRRRMQD